MQMFIIQRLVAILDQRNLSARQLSLMIDRSESYVNKIINRQIPFTLEEMDKICEALELTPQEFFAMPELETPELYVLIKEMHDLTAEDIEQLRSMIQYMKKKNAQIKKKK